MTDRLEIAAGILAGMATSEADLTKPHLSSHALAAADALIAAHEATAKPALDERKMMETKKKNHGGVLKPCPFCGEAKRLEPRPRCEAESGYLPLPLFYVGCMACHATGPRKDSRTAATRAWNKKVKEVTG